jgi:hypothetical protein
MRNLADPKTHDELVAERAARDPAFREEWEKTALARAFAIELIRYRADHDLSQAGLAALLDVKQPQVALGAGGEEPELGDAGARCRQARHRTRDRHRAGGTGSGARDEEGASEGDDAHRSQGSGFRHARCRSLTASGAIREPGRSRDNK